MRLTSSERGGVTDRPGDYGGTDTREGVRGDPGSERPHARSAWPEATGYTCAVEGDGRSAGSEIVFRSSDGIEQGRQRITAVEPGVVRNKMRNRGPRGTWVEPSVDFRVEPQGDGTMVQLDFDVTPPVPRLRHSIANRYSTRTIRPLHVEDLRRLKRLVEGGDAG